MADRLAQGAVAVILGCVWLVGFGVATLCEVLRVFAGKKRIW